MTKEDRITLLYNKYYRSMVSYTRNRVFGMEDVQDIVQETFCSAFKGYKNFLNLSTEKTWLFGILNHKIYDYYRLKKNKLIHNKLYDDDIIYKEMNFTEFGNDGYDTVNDLYKHVSHLKGIHKEVVLSYLSGESSDDTCERLKITKQNYRVRMFRGREKLAEIAGKLNA